MKKISTISKALKQSLTVLSVSQMSDIRGGSNPMDVLLNLPGASVGPLEATDDDKRRDRPGGGITTH